MPKGSRKRFLARTGASKCLCIACPRTTKAQTRKVVFTGRDFDGASASSPDVKPDLRQALRLAGLQLAKLIELPPQAMPEWTFRPQLLKECFGLVENVVVQWLGAKQFAPTARNLLFSKQIGTSRGKSLSLAGRQSFGRPATQESCIQAFLSLFYRPTG